MLLHGSPQFKYIGFKSLYAGYIVAEMKAVNVSHHLNEQLTTAR